ncbi:hypothetical protein, partial [Streptomyces nanshensis]|uniref:hypothetical protein n=1 Tax=Streptomyces nanshensis TaxID=518642 RepID=UPI003B84A8B6
MGPTLLPDTAAGAPPGAASSGGRPPPAVSPSVRPLYGGGPTPVRTRTVRRPERRGAPRCATGALGTGMPHAAQLP